MSYNFDEGKGDNNYNCPVVAYYPELLGANVTELKNVRYIDIYVGLHRPKDFAKRFSAYMEETMGVPAAETKAAVRRAYAAYGAYKDRIRALAAEYIDYARANGKRIAVVAGRPYHADPEINHGIDELISSLDMVVVSEDGVNGLVEKAPRRVLNQWTYQARMYDAARWAASQKDAELIQLISFGCGTDAITSDEVRDIMESACRLYTPIKIDDISNLGAVRIRLRSMLAACESREGRRG
jgi:predicted nucleotide-binding protein (sugar kinase/HSP70/actin superfamily)